MPSGWYTLAMSSPQSDASIPGGRDFATTRWSIVLATKGDASEARNALSKLCNAYWYPLYAYVRRQGLGAHDAQDLTQEFFVCLLEKDWLGAVERERGRFRSWLLASMKHFLGNEWDKRHAQKRGGGAAIFSIDEISAESRWRHEPADPQTAEKLYDRQWALLLLERVLRRLRQEMTVVGKGTTFDILKFSLTGEKCAYTEVAARLGMTGGAVKVAIHRLRERYRALIRAEIADTVMTSGEVDEELRHLFAAMSN
jgi:RNA polymerase sigma-70 factor (ECF subfamily)